MLDEQVKNVPFHFDFTVNLPLLAVVVSAIIAGTAWTSAISNRMGAVEERTRNLPAIETTLARLDERSKVSGTTLARIEDRIDRNEP